METLKPLETLDQGLVASEMGDAQNPCNDVHKQVSEVVAASAEKCTGPVSPSSDQAWNHCDEIPKSAVSVEMLTEQLSPLFGQTQNHCDEFPVEDPEFAAAAEKCTGPVSPSLDETQNPCDAMSVEVSEFSVPVEKLTEKVSPSLSQMQNEYVEIPVEDPEFTASAEKCTRPVSLSLGATLNRCDAMSVEVSEMSVSVEKLTEQMSPLGQQQNQCDGIAVEDSEFAASAEECTGPVLPSLDETQNHCDAIPVEVTEFSVSAEKVTDQVSSLLGQQQNHCDQIPVEDPEFAASAEKSAGPVLPSLDEAQNHCEAISVEVPDFSVSVEKLTEQVSPSLSESQNHCYEIPVEDPGFAASAETCTGPILPSLDETQNPCDAIPVEVPETSFSVEKLTEQVSPSLSQTQNQCDEIPAEAPEFAASAEKCTGPVLPSLDETLNPCDAIPVEVPEFSVSVDKLSEQVSSSLGEQQNHCDEISEFAVSVEKITDQMSPSGGSVEENACEVDSKNKLELPRNGISLIVELNDSVQGGSSNDLAKIVLAENSLSNGYVLQDDGYLSAKVGNEVVGGESVKDEKCQFNVDDLVWAKNKSHLWLPGIVYDPLNAPKEARKTEPTNCLLVKCLGNASFVWCLPSQLKPFLEFFEQMSKQSNSKSFLGALEKATAEIGRRVKMEMTCPCYSNGLEDKRGNFGEFSVTQFKPASFIARIRSLALDVSGRDKIECTLIQNQLSAFYRSIGHCQIPLHQLKPVNEGKDSARASEGTTPENKDEELTKLFGEDPNTVNKQRSSKSVKSFSLENGDRSSDGKSGRERRKSRYLSYPYVDIKLARKGSGEDEVEDLKEVSPFGMDKKSIQPMGSPSSVKTQRKWSRKGTTGNDASGQAVEINPSSAKVLSELRHVAIDCLYPRESEQFDAAENSILRYRKMEYQDYYSELASDRTVGQEFDHGVLPSQTSPTVQVHSDKGLANSMEVAGYNQVQQPFLNVLPKKRGRRKKEQLSDSKTSPIPILPVVGVPSDKGMLNSVEMAGNNLVKQPLANTVPKKRGRKKKEKLSESRPFPILPHPTNGPVMLDFQNVAPVAAVANQGLQQIEVMPSNGTTTILNFEDSQVMGPPLGKLQPKRRKKEEGDASNLAKLDSVLQEVQVMGPCMVQTIPELNNNGIKEPASFHLNFGAPACYTDITGNGAGQSQMGVLSPGSGVEPMKRKRKRKEKASELQNNVASAIPDLNGIGSDGKPQKKRRKRIIKAEACIDFSKLQNNGEISGPALLLKFAAGEPVPSKEALVSAFSGFGPLKELETQPLDNSDIAQVVFEISSNALDAFRSLEKNSPFGPGLVNFQLHNFSGETTQGLEGNKSPSGKLSGGKPQQKEAQDLPDIRKNLEMMTSILKKSGANLSPEMRAKLESEVNKLLEKVNDMVANSSSP